MQTRRKTGQYKSHHTPGDGTGLDTLPTKEDPTVILTDAHLAEDNGSGYGNTKQPYPAHETHHHEE